MKRKTTFLQNAFDKANFHWKLKDSKCPHIQGAASITRENDKYFDEGFWKVRHYHTYNLKCNECGWLGETIVEETSR
jgi:hypothetical protein